MKNKYLSLLELNPLSLPFIDSANLDKLPSLSAVYFVIVENEIVYIGKSTDLNIRWNKYLHHVTPQIEGEFKVHWLPTDKKTLGFVETLLIELHEPKLNKSVSVKTSKGDFSENDLLDAFYLGFNKGLLQGLKMGKSSTNNTVVQILQMQSKLKIINPLTTVECVSDADSSEIKTQKTNTHYRRLCPICGSKMRKAGERLRCENKAHTKEMGLKTYLLT
jgi:hypothetical protein